MIQLRIHKLPWHFSVRLPETVSKARAQFAVAVRPLRHLLHSSSGERAYRSTSEPSLSSSRSHQRLFEHWFARYQLPLLEYLFGMTRDREWAADLVQDTFLRAYSAGRSDPTAIEYPQAWLYRIATNTALSALRRRRVSRSLSLSGADLEAETGASDSWRQLGVTEPQSQDVAVTVAERDAVWTVLAELPARWRAVLLLQTTGGFEVREIALLLGISEANTRKILFRAKERFRQIYARLAEAEEKVGIT
jgi:RNA polymerase sigma-70 factor (ECF subfamily)